MSCMDEKIEKGPATIRLSDEAALKFQRLYDDIGKESSKISFATAAICAIASLRDEAVERSLFLIKIGANMEKVIEYLRVESNRYSDQNPDACFARIVQESIPGKPIQQDS